MNRRPMQSYLEANLAFLLLSALSQCDRRLSMFLWSSFAPIFPNVSISDAAAGSASSNGTHLVRSPLQYFNSRNRITSSSCANFVWPYIAFSDAITDVLIANLHTKYRFLLACNFRLWGTLRSEDKHNDSKNDAINMRKNYTYIFNQQIFFQMVK